MKLELTYNEACNYIREALNLSPDTRVTITDSPPSGVPMHDTIRKCIDEIHTMDYRNNLIKAIKTLRAASDLGLAQAKWAIEH